MEGAQRRAHAGAQGCGGERVRMHIDSWRRWRLAVTVLSATAFAAAVLVFVTLGDSEGRAAGDVLLSTAQRREFKEAKALKRVHGAYDRAKGRLERMSSEYTDLGVKLQAAESRASALRIELESKMRKIRSDFKRAGGAELSEQHSHGGSTMSLAELPSSMEQGGSNRLQHEVAALKSRMKRVDAREAKQAVELHQLRHQVPAVAEEEDADVGRFPRRPILAFRAERTRSL